MLIDREHKPEAIIPKATKNRPYRLGIDTPWVDVKKRAVYATDGSVAVRIPVDAVELDSTGPVPVEALREARKAAKASRISESTIRLENGSAKLETGLSIPRNAERATFPDIESVMPKRDANEEPTVRISAKLLAKLADAMGTDCVALFISGADAPVRVEPVRLTEAPPVYGDPVGVIMSIGEPKR